MIRATFFAFFTALLVGSNACGGRSTGGTGADASPDASPDASTACRTYADCNAFGGLAFCAGPINDATLCALTPACSATNECRNDEVCSTGEGEQAVGEDAGPDCRFIVAGICFDSPVCRPQCQSLADCNYWEACQPDGTCRPLSCDQCPSYLSCNDDECGPKSCENDSDCPGAYCVDKTCFATLGTCNPGCG
jgi:hypothetical protein